MIGYVTLGSNDFERAVSFYDALLAELGAKQVMKTERMAMWGNDPGSPMLGVCIPFDTQAASIGNGGMVALKVESPEAVTRLHAKALELGASDEGAPGPRGTAGFHGGYFRDLDGNKLLLFHNS